MLMSVQNFCNIIDMLYVLYRSGSHSYNKIFFCILSLIEIVRLA